jgi:ParB-like chromosome segregation protein Spo0J
MTNVAKQPTWSPTDPPLGRSTAEALRALDLIDSTVELSIDDLLVDRSPRRGGLISDHVEALAELGGRWPPIVVARRDKRVIDGLHRVAAARRLGHKTIVAKLFEASQDEAYVASVKCNVEHGLPLTLAERKNAARQILQINSSWSDRRIAAICGLSPGTLGAIRSRQLGQPSQLADGSVPVESRIGRDGRSRPVDSVAARQRVVAAIGDAPDLSLRKISSQVGSSPETVRAVRAQLAEHADEVIDAEWWRHDAALGSISGGRQLVTWLARANIDRAGWSQHVNAIPVSRAYNLAAEARRRAAAWNEFADELEFKVRSKPS